MLFISPPFGNYYSLDFKGVMPIKGSYTLDYRPGLFTQILKTLRYSFDNNGWINKIGLRNKGLNYAIQNYKKNSEIISIAILKKEEINIINDRIPKNMDIELNVSCPNLNKKMISNGLKCFLNRERKWCIIKLSPLVDKKLIDKYYQEGFRQFHCSNTIPTERGGLSGISLKTYNKNLITYIKNKYPDSTIIAGGGIRYKKDLEFYKNLGASHYSISTLLFNPLISTLFFYNYFKNKH